MWSRLHFGSSWTWLTHHYNFEDRSCISLYKGQFHCWYCFAPYQFFSLHGRKQKSLFPTPIEVGRLVVLHMLNQFGYRIFFFSIHWHIVSCNYSPCNFNALSPFSLCSYWCQSSLVRCVTSVKISSTLFMCLILLQPVVQRLVRCLPLLCLLSVYLHLYYSLT